MYVEKEINDLLVTIHPDFATVKRILRDYRLMIRGDDTYGTGLKAKHIQIHKNHVPFHYTLRSLYPMICRKHEMHFLSDKGVGNCHYN